MLKLLIVVLSILIKITVPTVYAVTTDEVPGYLPPFKKLVDNEYGKVFTKEEILPIVKLYAEKYNVSAEKMMYTIEAESHFANIQSRCHKSEFSLCDSVGVREESYGIAQFHISTLPKEKALNVNVSIERMAYHFSIGEACKWTEYRKRYGC